MTDAQRTMTGPEQQIPAGPQECRNLHPKWGACEKPGGHEGDHAVCLGYHPEWEDANGLLHQGEYEWVTWA